jgi:simple sugar transport system ATP-binding protein
MTAAGKTIVLISHKLDEVLAIADRITVLRGGRHMATVDNQGLTKAQLASLMVGREVLFRVEKPPAQLGEVRLVMEKVSARNDKGIAALRGLSLRLRSGEIVGVAGVAGNGQRELAEVISGLRPTDGGSIVISSQSVTNAPPIVINEAGIAYVPEDRSATGSAPDLSIAENLALKNYRTIGQGGRFFLSRRAMREQAQRLIQQFNIATPSPDTSARLLSGGNLQKVILARELAQQPLVTIAAYPTRGLDVGATENVRRILVNERNHGAAILLISEDLDEIFAIADRILVLFEGQIVGEMAAEEATLDKIGLMMAGAYSPETGTTSVGVAA